MTTPPSLAEMTLEELDEYNVGLMAQKDQIREEQRRVAAAWERRLALEEVSQMSPERRAALVEAAQAIEAAGVESTAELGTPGASS